MLVSLVESRSHGAQVVLGFIITAFATSILLVIHYILAYDPNKASLTHERNEHPNYVDCKILSWVATKVERPSQKWEDALQRVSNTVTTSIS